MALAWLIGGVPALAQSDESEPRLPPEPAWPPSSHYYEARITPEGYALYVPFFLPRSSESGEGGTVRPPWKNREPRHPTERDPVADGADAGLQGRRQEDRDEEQEEDAAGGDAEHGQTGDDEDPDGEAHAPDDPGAEIGAHVTEAPREAKRAEDAARSMA